MYYDSDLDRVMTNQDAKGDKARGQPIVYRIFLASPGDVCDERELARAVIEQIRTERAFRGRVDLEIIGLGPAGSRGRHGGRADASGGD